MNTVQTYVLFVMPDYKVGLYLQKSFPRIDGGAEPVEAYHVPAYRVEEALYTCHVDHCPAWAVPMEDFLKGRVC